MRRYFAFILIDYKLSVLIMEAEVTCMRGHGGSSSDGKNTVVMNKYAAQHRRLNTATSFSC